MPINNNEALSTISEQTNINQLESKILIGIKLKKFTIKYANINDFPVIPIDLSKYIL